MSDRLLPSEFSDLETYSAWALPNETARRQKRMASSMEELRVFYDAILPRLDDALDYLNQFPLSGLPEDAKRLYFLTLSMTEVSIAIELVRHPGIPDGVDPDRLVPVHDW